MVAEAAHGSGGAAQGLRVVAPPLVYLSLSLPGKCCRVHSARKQCPQHFTGNLEPTAEQRDERNVTAINVRRGRKEE